MWWRSPVEAESAQEPAVPTPDAPAPNPSAVPGAEDGGPDEPAGPDGLTLARSWARFPQAVMVLTIGVLGVVAVLLEVHSTWGELRAAPVLFDLLAIWPVLLGPLAAVGVGLHEALRPSRRSPGRLAAVALLAWAFNVLSNLAALILAIWLPVHTYAANAEGGHLVATMNCAAVCGLVIVTLGVRRGMLLCLPFHPLLVAVRVVAGGEDPVQAFLDMNYGMAVAGIYFLFLPSILQAARRTAAYSSRARAEAALAARSQARRSTRLRIGAMVHDDVIAPLVAVRTQPPPPLQAMRAQAETARQALAQMSAGALEPIRGALAGELERMADILSTDTHRFTVSATAIPALPAAAHDALFGAAREAMRNVRRHATGSRPVTCAVRLRARNGAVSLEVVDDGVGFDLGAGVSAGLGLRGSVLGRMSALPGGRALVDTAPGRGTRVLLNWRPDRAGAPDAAGPQGTANSRRVGGETGTRDTDPVEPTMETVLSGPLGRRVVAVVVGLVCIHCLLQIDAYDGVWRSIVSLALVLTVLAMVVRVVGGPARLEMRGPGVSPAGLLSTGGDVPPEGPSGADAGGPGASASPGRARGSWRSRLILPNAVAALACCAAAPYVLLAGARPTPIIGSLGWPASYIALVVPLLMLRHHDLLALGCVAVGVLGLVGGALEAGLAPDAVAAFVPYPLMIALNCVLGLTAIRLVFWRARCAEEEAQFRLLERLRAQEAERIRAELIERVHSACDWVLAGICDMTAVSEQLRRDASLAEAELRDLLRAPRLLEIEALAAQVARARRRGASVLLQDDARADASALSAREVPGSVVAEALRILGRAGGGERVVVRLCPDHARNLATLQRTGPDGVIDWVDLPRPAAVVQSASRSVSRTTPRDGGPVWPWALKRG